MIILKKKKKTTSISVQEFIMYILYIQKKAIHTWEVRQLCLCDEWVDIPFIAENKN